LEQNQSNRRAAHARTPDVDVLVAQQRLPPQNERGFTGGSQRGLRGGEGKLCTAGVNGVTKYATTDGL